MSAPKQHKAAQIKEKNAKYSIETIETPQPGPNEVLIKVTASGICASDHFAISGMMPAPFPMSPGHEVVGKIVSHGQNVDKGLWSDGQTVGVGWNGGFCTHCNPCRAGDFIHCDKHKVTGITQQGGHQEYLIVDQTALVNLPANSGMTDAEMAPLLCAGNTVYEALINSGAKAGDVVIVQGLGGLGHLAIQYGHRMGCIVIGFSGSPEKKELALKLGADHYISADQDVAAEVNKIGLAKAVIATAPSGKAPAQLIPLLANYGTLVIVGAPADGSSLEVNTMDLISKFARIQGVTCGSASSNDKVTQWSAKAGIKAMVTEWPLEKAQEAWNDTQNGKPKFRNVIVFK
ncbi:hypothetical protein CBS101457_006324 [Exobasidium rhododendri]|nr:hypothetical protein CBS101457_006324 [Exobasidium rhododendri]